MRLTFWGSLVVIVSDKRPTSSRVFKFEREVEKPDGSLIDMDYTETSDVNTTNPKLFLYQSGYLTIKNVIEDSYVLGFPNREVKKALFELVLPIMLKKKLIAHTPYSTQKQNDLFLKSIFVFLSKHLQLVTFFLIIAILIVKIGGL